MHLASVPLATLFLLLPVAGSPAQAPANHGAVTNPASPQIVVRSSPDGLSPAQALSCPVSLDVRHGTGWARRSPVGTADGFAHKPAGQSLDVTVLNRASSEITSLDVLVRLRSVNVGMMPLVSMGENLGEHLPLHIDMSVQADKDAAASWMVASTRPVAYVEISKVSYRDSSIWSASKGSACQFTPNPMMLISSR